MLSALPPEIISIIITEASESDLLALALVSHTFLHPAREELYRTIDITYADEGSRESDEFVYTTSTNDKFVSQSNSQVQLLRTINRHAHLATLVRHLSIRFNTLEEEAERSTELMLGLILRVCEHLSTVTYKGSTVSDSKAVIGITSTIPPKNLERFGPVTIFHEADLNRKFLASQPLLRSLVIACDLERAGEPPSVDVWPAHLETLRIRGDTMPPLAFITLTTNSLHSITTLRLTIEGVDSFPDFSALSSLSTLSLKLHRDVDWPEPQTYDPLCKILGRCTKLQRFEIGIFDHRLRSHRGAIALILRRILPSVPPVVLLAFSDRDCEIPLDVVTKIASSNTQPNLREVWIAATAETWAMSAAQELVRACAARGVVARTQDWNWETDP